MITDKEFLKAELEMGISFDNPNFIELAHNTAKQVIGLGTTILDYGAGTGIYSNEATKLGFDVSIYEIFESHREYISQNAPHLKIIDAPITTDIMFFIEVAEHMTDKELNALFIKIKPKYILFSSTSQKVTGWDENWGHINIKEQDDWVSFFKKKGYELEKNLPQPTDYTKLFKYIK